MTCREWFATLCLTHVDSFRGAVRNSGDFDAYWATHPAQQNQRNHVARYEDGAIPDPLPAPKPRLRRVR